MKKIGKWLLITIVFAVFAVIGNIIANYLFRIYSGYQVFPREALNYFFYDNMFQYHDLIETNEIIKKNLSKAYVINLLIASIPLWFTVLIKFIKIKPSLHGDAKWADLPKLKKLGFVRTAKQRKKEKYPAVLIGKYKDHFLEFSSNEFLSLGAGTRSGKGVGIVIPNLIYYYGSVVVLDIKFENFELTGGWRKKMGQEVVLFAPDGYEDKDGDITTARFNPLYYVREDLNYRVGDLLNIAEILYPTSGGDEDIWAQGAQKIFVGLALYLMDMKNAEKIEKQDDMDILSIPSIIKLLTPKAKSFKEWVGDQLKKNLDISEDCRSYLTPYSTAPDRTAGSYLSNFEAPLDIFKNSTCSYACSGNTFDFNDLRKKPMSIYLGISPSTIGSYRVLINMFFSILVLQNTRELPEKNPALKHQCLLMLDEFTAAGKIKQILTSIAYTAGYNIRYFLIYQAESQLANDQAYGSDGADTLLSNMSVKITYPDKEVTEEVETLSKSIGYITYKDKNKSISSTGGTGVNVTNARSKQQRALILPQEIVALREEYYTMKNGTQTDFMIKQILNIRGTYVLCDKIVYFDDPFFKERVEFSKNNTVKQPIIKMKFDNVSKEKEII